MLDPEVWLTEKGSRYHVSSSCSVLRDPGTVQHLLSRSRLSDVGVKRTPCSRCWPDDPDWTAWSALDHSVLRGRQSWYEVDFYEKVIRRLPDVSAAQIEFQRQLTDSKGRNRFVDFAIHARNGRRIAIELDGRQKTSDGRHRSQEAQDDFNYRQNEVLLQGWLLLRYSNSQFRLHADECLEEIQRAMQPPVPEPVGSVDVPVAESTVTTAALHLRSIAETDTSAESRGRHPERYSGGSVAGTSRGWRPWAALAVASVAVLLFVVVRVLGGSGQTEVVPASGSCPLEFPIKGNESRSGDLIYHEKGWRYYASTFAERCFRDGPTAEEAGFRASEVQ